MLIATLATETITHKNDFFYTWARSRECARNYLTISPRQAPCLDIEYKSLSLSMTYSTNLFLTHSHSHSLSPPPHTHFANATRLQNHTCTHSYKSHPEKSDFKNDTRPLTSTVQQDSLEAHTYIYIYLEDSRGSLSRREEVGQERGLGLREPRVNRLSACVSIRQHTSAHVSTRQHTSA